MPTTVSFGDSRIHQTSVTPRSPNPYLSSDHRSVNLVTTIIHFVSANCTGDGSSWVNAAGDLQAVIDTAAPGEQIWVASGTYKPGRSRNSSFAMKDGVAIYGGFRGVETNLTQRPASTFLAPSRSILSGYIGRSSERSGNSYHVIRNPSGLTSAAILDGFVIMGGNANGIYPNDSGGGILNNGNSHTCSPTIRNCLFTDNSAHYGGGVYNDGSYLGDCQPTFTNCIFNSNQASFGGAICNQGSAGTSSPTLINCAFLTNKANFGGALYNMGISGKADPKVLNCSFSGNNAIEGGTMHNDGSFGTSNPQLINCVVSGNGGINTFFNRQATIKAKYSLFDKSVKGYAGTNNRTTTLSPFIQPTTLELHNQSTAIDTGNDVAYREMNGPLTDLAGKPRIVGLSVDMGAFEYQR